MGDLLKIQNGRPVTGSRRGLCPSSETVIHETIYRAVPSVNAVFHVHPIYSTLISCFHGHPKEQRFLHVDWFETLKTIGVGDEESAEIALIPNWQDASRIAKDITAYWTTAAKPLPVALIYNHGLTAWGDTPEHVRNYLESMEYVCEYLYLKQRAGFKR